MLIAEIKVIPGSKNQAWSQDASGTIRCHLKSQPQRGEANKELIKALSKALGVSFAQISIISGATSRYKRLKINASITYNDLLKALCIETQMNIFAHK